MNSTQQGDRDRDNRTPDMQATSGAAAGQPNENVEAWEQELRGGPHGLGQDGPQPDRGSSAADARPQQGRDGR